MHIAPDAVSGTFPPAAGSGTARAVAVVALSEPMDAESPDTGLQEVHQTAIREREPSEPAPVLPLHRRKDASQSEEELREATGEASTEEPAEPRRSAPERDTSLPNIPIPAGPPILASDLLREQMRPSNPGANTLRVVTVTLAALGAVGALVTGGLHPLAFVSLALLIVTATLALTPMSYRARAVSLTLAGSAATGVALWQQVTHGGSPVSIILAGAVIVLSGALLFRAYYRGARLSRFAVAVGVAALGTWFIISGGHESLVMLEGHWQSWAPAGTQMTFGLLALLSLMAFMESSTRGGAHVWGVALLVLYALHVSLLIAGHVWPMDGGDARIDGPTIAAFLTGMVGTIVAGLALAQVFVAIYQSASSRSKA